MDGFTPYPSAVSMGHFVSTLLQLKSQVDFMDQFLSLYVPDYVQLKNYAIETQQQNGYSPPLNTHIPGAIPPMAEHLTQPMAASTFNHYLVDQGATNVKVEQENDASVSSVKGKVPRKQTLVKKTSTGSNPANLKRRGRKRKYPINPNEANQIPFSADGFQTVPQTVEVVTNMNIPVPPPSTLISSGSNRPGSSTKVMSSLDVLAAVSYVLKQNDMSNISVPPNTVISGNENVEPQAQQYAPYTGTAQESQQEQDSNKNNGEQQDVDSNQVYDSIRSVEVQVEELDSRKTLLLHNHQYQVGQTSEQHHGSITLHQQKQYSPSSSLTHIPQNPEAYVIAGPAEHEVIV